MLHKAIKLDFLQNTTLQLTFQDGVVRQYDVAVLFDKYPQLKALKNRELFLSGKLMGFYGIIWNDELDLEAETVYEEGTSVAVPVHAIRQDLSAVLTSARARVGYSQKQVAEKAGIDQSDYSKIERGIANPSLAMLERIAVALDGDLIIQIEPSSTKL